MTPGWGIIQLAFSGPQDVWDTVRGVSYVNNTELVRLHGSSTGNVWNNNIYLYIYLTSPITVYCLSPDVCLLLLNGPVVAAHCGGDGGGVVVS